MIFEIYKKHKLLDYTIVFVFCAYSRCIIIHDLHFGVPSSDEVSAISIAALLAGYDWKDVVSNAGYYGIGYLWIFFLLYRIGLKAELIYRIVCAMSGVLIGLTGCISYRIIDRYFEDIGRITKVCISLFMGSASVLCTYIFSERNEEILLLVAWLIAYVLFSIFIEGNTMSKQLMLIMLMCYSLTVHTRAIIFILSLSILFIFYAIVERKCLFSLKLILVMTVMTALVSYALSVYRGTIWNTEIVRNASVSDTIVNGLKIDLWSPKGIQAIMMILFGHIFTAAEMTGGIYVLSLATVGVLVVLVVKRMLPDEYRSLLWIGIYFTVCSLGVVAGLSISWRPGVYTGLVSGKTDWVYGYKAITYMRYPGPFMPPLLLSGILLFLQAEKKIRKIIAVTAFIIIGTSTIFWKMVIEPYAVNQKPEVMFFMSLLKDGQEATWGRWQLTYAVVLLFAVVICAMTSLKTRYWEVYLLAIAIYMSVLKINVFNNMTNPFNWYFVGQVSESAEFLNKIKKEIDRDTCIYVVDNSGLTDHQTWYRYQYICYDLHIVPGMPDSLVDDNIIVTNTAMEELSANGFDVAEITPDEFIYYKGEDNAVIIKNASR